MFIHSVKVHPIYKKAAKIIKSVCEDGKGVKDMLFQETHSNIKALNALVFETLKHGPLLDVLLSNSCIIENESRLDPWLCRVLMTEMLWGQKDKLESEAKPVKAVLKYYEKFQEILKDKSIDLPEPIEQVYHPRYVRINTLTITVQDAVNGFRDEGWVLVRPGDDWTYEQHLQAVRDLQPGHFIPDFHIPELFAFPPGSHFHDYECYLQGQIVLQDKASCMASLLLSPEPGSTVLDMCAAPGMKTTHLAAIIGNQGTIYAVERNPRRFEMLNNILQATGATCAKTVNEDVLKTNDAVCPDVEYVLVDPSCSGSGMLDRIETSGHLKHVDKDRLKSLSGFQILILRHALTAYPKAKRVVYSTCSIMPEENEQVVKEVLATTKQFRLVPVKELLKKEWSSYGSKDFKGIGENCLVAKSEHDYTNGFFVAVFERIAPYDERDLYIRGRKWKTDEENLDFGNDMTGSEFLDKRNKGRKRKADDKSGVSDDLRMKKVKKGHMDDECKEKLNSDDVKVKHGNTGSLHGKVITNIKTKSKKRRIRRITTKVKDTELISEDVNNLDGKIDTNVKIKSKKLTEHEELPKKMHKGNVNSAAKIKDRKKDVEQQNNADSKIDMNLLTKSKKLRERRKRRRDILKRKVDSAVEKKNRKKDVKTKQENNLDGEMNKNGSELHSKKVKKNKNKADIDNVENLYGDTNLISNVKHDKKSKKSKKHKELSEVVETILNNADLAKKKSKKRMNEVSENVDESEKVRKSKKLKISKTEECIDNNDVDIKKVKKKKSKNLD